MRDARAAETQRLAALDRYDILDTEAEQGFDDIVNLAAILCATPVSLVSLVAADRQWFKAQTGFEPFQTPLSHSVCAHAIRQQGLLVIPDLTGDDRTRHNPLVTQPPHIRFYAGAVLETPQGHALGTLCVIDTRPRPEGLTPSQAIGLQALARQVMTQLELRLVARTMSETSRQLEAGRARYQAIFDSAVDNAIIVIDRDGSITDWNAGAVRVFGWTAAEVKGRNASIFFTPEDCAAGIPALEMERAMSTGRGIDERWHVRKSGERFWADGEMRPLRLPTGELQGFVKILRDQTEARVAQDRLTASERRWRRLFENMHEGFFVGELIRDAHGKAYDYRFLEINPAFAGQSGLPPTSVGKTIRTFAKDVQQGLIDRFALSVDTGAPQAFEIHLPDLQRWFEVRSTKDAGERFSCLFLDITPRKMIEQQLAVQDERLQMALDASGIVGLWDWMTDTDLLHGDANFARLYGLDIARTAAGLTMREYQEFVVPEDLAELRRRIAAVFEKGADFLIDYRLAIPGQPLRWVECKGKLIHDAAGKPIRFSGTAIDITDRKSAEHQKQLLMEELSHRVKNSFAVVLAIAEQTLRRTDPDTADTLQNRLLALSRAHNILLQTTWSSAGIHGLLGSVLRLDAEGGRFDIDGPPLEVGARAVLSLSLLLHEMTTNAVKYGALSVDEGRVEVRWTVEGDRFRLTWREIGGPPAHEPARRGFGSRLISMGIAGCRLVDLHYGPAGLSAAFAAPLAKLMEDEARRDTR